MKEEIQNILREYLNIFPNEEEKQLTLFNYLNNHSDNEIIDWNNFEGHIVASGFIYSKIEEKFLVMFHNDMKIYTYPGGHIDSDDKNPFEAAKREVIEETRIRNFQTIALKNNNLIPIDIDTHLINYNERLNLPEHYHFDFRYLFVIEEIPEIIIDENELSEYKWISKTEFYHQFNLKDKLNKFI